MGKLHNIATGVMIIGGILGPGNEAVSQNVGNSNSKAGIGNIQNSTNNQIANIDSIEHEKIIHMTLDEILSTYGDVEGSVIIRKHTFIEINNLRAKYGAPPLIEIFELDVAAQLHTQWMDENGVLSHTGENRSDPTIRARENGFSGFTSGENVGNVASKERWNIYDMINQQVMSPSHLKSLIDEENLYVGFGVCGFYFDVILGQ